MKKTIIIKARVRCFKLLLWILMMFYYNVFAQKTVIFTSSVYDFNSHPIAGVDIQIINSGINASTDSTGKFRLLVSESDVDSVFTLILTKLGYTAIFYDVKFDTLFNNSVGGRYPFMEFNLDDSIYGSLQDKKYISGNVLQSSPLRSRVSDIYVFSNVDPMTNDDGNPNPFRIPVQNYINKDCIRICIYSPGYKPIQKFIKKDELIRIRPGGTLQLHDIILDPVISNYITLHSDPDSATFILDHPLWNPSRTPLSIFIGQGGVLPKKYAFQMFKNIYYIKKDSISLGYNTQKDTTILLETLKPELIFPKIDKNAHYDTIKIEYKVPMNINLGTIDYFLKIDYDSLEYLSHKDVRDINRRGVKRVSFNYNELTDVDTTNESLWVRGFIRYPTEKLYSHFNINTAKYSFLFYVYPKLFERPEAEFYEKNIFSPVKFSYNPSRFYGGVVGFKYQNHNTIAQNEGNAIYRSLFANRVELFYRLYDKKKYSRFDKNLFYRWYEGKIFSSLSNEINKPNYSYYGVTFGLENAWLHKVKGTYIGYGWGASCSMLDMNRAGGQMFCDLLGIGVLRLYEDGLLVKPYLLLKALNCKDDQHVASREYSFGTGFGLDIEMKYENLHLFINFARFNHNSVDFSKYSLGVGYYIEHK